MHDFCFRHCGSGPGRSVHSLSHACAAAAIHRHPSSPPPLWHTNTELHFTTVFASLCILAWEIFSVLLSRNRIEHWALVVGCLTLGGYDCEPTEQFCIIHPSCAFRLLRSGFLWDSPVDLISHCRCSKCRALRGTVVERQLSCAQCAPPKRGECYYTMVRGPYRLTGIVILGALVT
ncbi:hypothetical protein BJV74DRAFT_339847 [Russula compacta]|nr:hypothetical protein BJV74DRAFT_339847 [Russula compacta]